MNRYFLLLVLGLLPLLSVKAQLTNAEKHQNAIGLTIGTDFTYLKDVNFSPLNNSGRGYAIGIDYSRATKKGQLFFANLHYSNGLLKSKASDFFSYDRHLASLEVGYLTKVLDRKNRLTIHAGAIVNSRIDLLDYRGFSAVTFSNFHGLLLSSKLVYSLKEKQRFYASFSVPVLGKLARPAYSGWDKFMVENKSNLLKVLYRGDWTSFNHLVGLDLQLGYHYTLSDKFDLTAQHKLSYLKTDTPQKAIIVRNYTQVGLNFKF